MVSRPLHRMELDHDGACRYGNAVEYSRPRMYMAVLGLRLCLSHYLFCALVRPTSWGYDQEDPQLRQYSAEMGIGVAVPDRQRLLAQQPASPSRWGQEQLTLEWADRGELRRPHRAGRAPRDRNPTPTL